MLISVVINTLDRAKYITHTLDALITQTYKDFEIIVINGPSLDNTVEVVNSYCLADPRVKFYQISQNNLSVSRNEGIRRSQGDLIAFIDDDAIPEADWLQVIVSYYLGHKDPALGAIGGKVYNEDRSFVQFDGGFVGIWGEVFMIADKGKTYNEPKGYYYNTVMGTNAIFVRKPLLAVGGFDEEMEYFHDESDVCARLVKQGYLVKSLATAVVRHCYAPSVIRDTNKQFTNWNAIAKNRIYFAIKNSANNAPLLLRIFKPLTLENDKFLKIFETDSNLLLKLSKSVSLIGAIFKGYFKGFFEARKLINRGAML